MEYAVLTREELSIYDFGRGMGMDTHSSEAIAHTLADMQKAQGDALIAGGVAVIHYGYKRYTHVIDILYPNHDEADILRRLKKDFKIVLKAENGWHHFEHRKTKVRLELIPEGGLTQYGFIPGPKIVGGENGFVSLFGLVWMKLVSGREKNDADLMEVAKTGQLSSMRKLCEKLPAELRERYTAILDRAERELRTDKGRIENADRAEEPKSRYGKLKRKRKKARA